MWADVTAVVPPLTWIRRLANRSSCEKIPSYTPIKVRGAEWRSQYSENNALKATTKNIKESEIFKVRNVKRSNTKDFKNAIKMGFTVNKETFDVKFLRFVSEHLASEWLAHRLNIQIGNSNIDWTTILCKSHSLSICISCYYWVKIYVSFQDERRQTTTHKILYSYKSK